METSKVTDIQGQRASHSPATSHHGPARWRAVPEQSQCCRPSREPAWRWTAVLASRCRDQAEVSGKTLNGRLQTRGQTAVGQVGWLYLLPRWGPQHCKAAPLCPGLLGIVLRSSRGPSGPWAAHDLRGAR